MQHCSNLTFFDPTNISLPFPVYEAIMKDAVYFGFIKNETPNISGFLNHLIPRLAQYRDDLHDDFIHHNHGDKHLVKIIEENIFKLYFSKYDFCDDAFMDVPLRVNKKHMSEFVNIGEVKTAKYNLTFTELVRSMLIEYTSKRLYQREYFFFYYEINTIKNAIQNNQLCRIYTKSESFHLIPLSIELSSAYDNNYIVGISPNKENAVFVNLHNIKEFVATEQVYEISSDDCNAVAEAMLHFFNEEGEICLD